MEKEFGSFRKASFGGFNRKDVINYIEKMTNEFYEYRKQVEETITSLNGKIRELESAASITEKSGVAEVYGVNYQASREYFGDIGQATKHLKVVSDELCKSLGDFMEKLNQKGLFDKEEESDYVNASAEEEQKTEKSSIVDDILSSISYLGKAAPADRIAADEAGKSNIADIISGCSFVK